MLECEKPTDHQELRMTEIFLYLAYIEAPPRMVLVPKASTLLLNIEWSTLMLPDISDVCVKNTVSESVALNCYDISDIS